MKAKGAQESKGWMRQGVFGLALCALTWMGAPGVLAATQTRTSAFEYAATNGLLTKEIIEPDSSSLCLVTSYAYDAFGNVTSTTVRNCAGPSGEEVAGAPAANTSPVIVTRTSTTTFESNTYTPPGGTALSYPAGQFPTTVTNALTQSETKVFDPRFGNVVSLTGPNSLSTTWQTDGFGRKTLETRADGTQTKTEYIFCNGVNGGTATCPTINGAAGKYLIQVTPLASGGAQNGARSRVYFDMLGREIRTETQGWDGGTTALTVYVDTEYDQYGRVSRKSNPYGSLEASYWTSFTYDAIGRVLRETRPDATYTEKVYNGLTITTKVCGNTSGTCLTSEIQQRVETRNAQGQVVTVTDNAGNNTTYTYDPFGNLLTTTDALGNKVSMGYDLRGRKTSMVDPDMGSWSYEYDVLGQLKKQTDAKAQVVTMVYDVLGRLTQRNEPDLVSNWYYDKYQDNSACNKGKGKLCEKKADNGYRQKITYDALGRESSVATYVDSATTPYTTGATYNADGRVLTQSYPTGFAVKYVYTARGYLKELQRNDTNALLFKVNTLSAKGELLQFQQGNGVVTDQTFQTRMGRLLTTMAGTGNAVQNMTYAYDGLGNLSSRQDGNFSQLENFQYDNLNRLLAWQIQGTGITGTISKTLTYNAIGNILTKSDVSGTYTYNASGPTSIRPHAIASLMNGATTVTSFTYDANGNLTAGDGRTLTYTSYNIPSLITKGTSTLTFTFDTEHQRVKEVSPTDTKILVMAGVHYEKEVPTSGPTKHNHYLRAYGMLIGVHVTRSDATSATRYFHLDHLGSIRVITNEAGTVLERLNYDPWGKRRNANGTDDTGGILMGQHTDRGFTGHEHLEEVQLIHMNGRVYDPRLGRFMQADPFIQAPLNGQSYNRYTYGFNNPVSGVDPSGYSFLSDLDDPFKTTKRIFSHEAKMWKAFNPIYATYNLTKTLYLSNKALFDGGSHSFGNAMLISSHRLIPYQTEIDDYLREHPNAAKIVMAVGMIACTAITVGVGAAGCAAGISAYGTAVYGGSNSDIFRSAASTYITASVAPYYGKTWNMQRVLVTGLANGVSAKIQGRNFSKAFWTGFGMASLSYAARLMRQEMIEQSELNPSGANSRGESVGFDGDGFKLGGGRFDADCVAKANCELSPMGGFQGQKGFFIRWHYEPGSLEDRLVEAYAGPHDFLNSPYWYDKMGNISQGMSAFERGFGEILNYANVVPATAFVAASVLPSSTYGLLLK